jgi:tetratricopeptide (TPR) repeat protein
MTGCSAVLFLLLAGSASAQFNSGSMAMMGRVRVQVLFLNHAACAPTTLVTLESSAGFNFASSSVDGRCVADFYDVPAGNYRARVSGADVAHVDNVEFALSPGMTQDVEVRVRSTDSSDPSQQVSASAFVSVSDLGVPSRAEKEFDKASRLVLKQDWEKAAERLHRAIEIYPRYAAAYNNLGAVYSHMGNLTQAREALLSAIALNDHMASAYVNLGRVSYNAKDFPGVEASIGKALSLAAPNLVEYTLLAYAQLADRHFDEAIATTRQAHRSQLGHHAVLHLLAAGAEDMQGKDEAATADLQQYLDEDPTGPRADEVRKAIADARR